MLGMLPGGLLELGAAALGAHLGGLTGLSIGWVAAIYVESMFMFRTVYKAVFPSEESAPSTKLQYKEAQAFWLMDTSPLPAIGQSYMAAGAPWLVDTFLLPAMRLPAKGQVSREMGRSKLKPLRLQSYIEIKK